jgi:hypothetical protein
VCLDLILDQPGEAAGISGTSDLDLMEAARISPTSYPDGDSTVPIAPRFWAVEVTTSARHRIDRLRDQDAFVVVCLANACFCPDAVRCHDSFLL